MSDDQNSSASGTPDWERVARAMAGRGWLSVPPSSDTGVPDGQPATVLETLATALRPALPAAPSRADTELALTSVMRRRHQVVVPPAGRGIPWRGPAWLAAGVVLAILGVRREIVHRQHADPALARPAFARSFAPAGATGAHQVASIRLPDGSVIDLGPATAVDTAVGFSEGRREIELRGAAFLNVTHDAAHPFTVRTMIGVVRDVGTSFVVRSDAPGGLVVAVKSGAVAVRRGSERPADERQLGAGDRGVFPMEGAVRVERGAGADVDLAVARGRMVLDAAPMSEVIESMRRWYGLDLRVEGAALASRRVSVTFGGESGPDAARILAAALGARARIAGDTAWITPVTVPVL